MTASARPRRLTAGGAMMAAAAALCAPSLALAQPVVCKGRPPACDNSCRRNLEGNANANAAAEAQAAAEANASAQPGAGAQPGASAQAAPGAQAAPSDQAAVSAPPSPGAPPADAALGEVIPQEPTTVSEVVIVGVRRPRRLHVPLDAVPGSILQHPSDSAAWMADDLASALDGMGGVNLPQPGAPESIRGGGVQVHGLTEVSTTLNGRDAFAANGARTLLWEDVTPELMASVEVGTSFSPQTLEGGIGGTIDLSTHMPFDFHGRKIAGQITYSDGDLVGRGEPRGSILYSDRWDTRAGKLGLLVDLSEGDSASRYDSIQVQPYYPHGLGATASFLPGGFSWRQSLSQQTRQGAYAAVQWAPSDDLSVFLVDFRSHYRSTSQSRSLGNGDGIYSALGGAAGEFDAGGMLQSGQLVYTGYDPLPCGAKLPRGDSCSLISSGASASGGWSRTHDLSFGGEWRPSQAIDLHSALQLVTSSAGSSGLDLSAETSIPGFGFAATGGPPRIDLASASRLADPSNYIWYSTGSHMDQHTGRELAWNADGEYKFPGARLLRALKLGLRLSRKQAVDNNANYRWAALTPTWDYPRVKFLNAAQPGDIEITGLGDFLSGSGAPVQAVFPAMALATRGDVAGLHQLYGEPGDVQKPAALTPQNRASVRVRSAAAYAALAFGRDLFGVPMNGEVGVRVVHTETVGDGFVSLPTEQILFNGAEVSLPGGYTANGAGAANTQALPSVSVELAPRDDVHLRLAASRSMAYPSLYALSAAGSVGVVTDPSTHAIVHATANIGDPTLKPELSTNLDISLEWNVTHDALLRAAVFHKTISQYLTYGVYSQNFPLTMPDGSRQMVPTAVTNAFNADQPVQLQGAELDAQTALKFLPGPLSGLGMEANFTYIDGFNPSNLSHDMWGHAEAGLPVSQLSRQNYNLTGTYSSGPLDVRATWSWRSGSFQTSAEWDSTGSYENAALGQLVTYNLPVFAAPSEQLDLRSTYRLTPHVTLSVEGQNLTGSTSQTFVSAGSESWGRSWSVADRRYLTAVRFDF